MRARTAVIVTSATLTLGAPAAQAGLAVLPAKKPALTAAKHHSKARAHKQVSKTHSVASTTAYTFTSGGNDGSSNRSGMTELTPEQAVMYADDCEDDV